jgi:hypothetical protein
VSFIFRLIVCGLKYDNDVGVKDMAMGIKVIGVDKWRKWIVMR